MAKVTLSVIKADVGGFVGHSGMHPAVVAKAQELLVKGKDKGLLADGWVGAVGDDLQLIMTHRKGEANTEVHRLAWDIFLAGTQIARDLKLYGAGQDLLGEAFTGTVRGMGPGLAEMEFEERTSEPVIVFMADKTSAGAWNLPLYKMFADPFNTPGLVLSESLRRGFSFEVLDVRLHKQIRLHAPEDQYDLLMFLGAPARFTVKRVFNRNTGEIAASSSAEQHTEVAGHYVGKDDPIMAIRCQGSFPAVGEVLEPFVLPYLVEGWMRGSHYGPLMPSSFRNASPLRFDGPPRLIAAGFQIANGKLVGPRDMFDDPAYDETRRQATKVADYLRRHGPFEPHRLPLDEMEYTTLAGVMRKLEGRWVDQNGR